ncbi:protein commissureless 1-like [Lucilia cuprina]|uniref:protein commissureless 1-like n=1 Tax=Lucilia cuprina TaxID=7375 RepID=UPI001F067E40|nr:protein commissureless 1-like [Lucilia cuprina]
MSDLQILNNQSTTTSDRFEIQNFDLIQNYSVLINKLEQLALGVDATLDNIAVDHKAVELTLGKGDLLTDSITASRTGPPHVTLAHGLEEVEYSRVVSDIWIGVILTLLIVSVIFFICACFLYHKFQQWKNSS